VTGDHTDLALHAALVLAGGQQGESRAGKGGGIREGDRLRRQPAGHQKCAQAQACFATRPRLAIAGETNLLRFKTEQAGIIAPRSWCSRPGWLPIQPCYQLHTGHYQDPARRRETQRARWPQGSPQVAQAKVARRPVARAMPRAGLPKLLRALNPLARHCS
jgi:hypothetical protein